MLRGLRCRVPVVALCLLLSRLALAVCQVQTVASIAPTDPSGGPTNVQITPISGPSNGSAVAVEGLTERLSDILIRDDGQSPNCLSTGNNLTILYTVPVTVPALPATLTSPANFDIYDSLGLLVVSIAGTTSATQSSITIQVLNGGTPGDLTRSATGSAVRIKNIRAKPTST
jgi:hypothetical protein